MTNGVHTCGQGEGEVSAPQPWLRVLQLHTKCGLAVQLTATIQRWQDLFLRQQVRSWPVWQFSSMASGRFTRERSSFPITSQVEWVQKRMTVWESHVVPVCEHLWVLTLSDKSQLDYDFWFPISCFENFLSLQKSNRFFMSFRTRTEWWERGLLIILPSCWNLVIFGLHHAPKSSPMSLIFFKWILCLSKIMLYLSLHAWLI